MQSANPSCNIHRSGKIRAYIAVAMVFCGLTLDKTAMEAYELPKLIPTTFGRESSIGGSALPFGKGVSAILEIRGREDRDGIKKLIKNLLESHDLRLVSPSTTTRR
jgi:hypothetical protein